MTTGTDSGGAGGDGTGRLPAGPVVRVRARGRRAGRRVPVGDTARVARAALVLLPGGDLTVEDASGPPPATGTYLPFPTLPSCRLLVPLDTAAAAAQALRLRTPPGGHGLRVLAYRGAAAALRLGLLQRLAGTRVVVPSAQALGADAADRSLVAHLGEVLGRPVVLGVRVGIPDPHRTIGMHVLGLDGSLLAFVKAASAELPSAQLRTEARALRALAAARPTRLEVPRLVDEREWNGLHVIVTTPLDLTGARQPAAGQSPAADVLREVAAAGRREDVALRASTYWAGVHRRLDELARAGVVPPARTGLASDLVAGVAALCGDTTLRFGAWHGDWLPWNLSHRPGRLLAWDWEYWDDSVPLGFDELHFHMGTAFFREQSDFASAFALTRSRAQERLRELGLDERQRDGVVLLYLLEFLLRRLDIATAGGGADDSRVFPHLLVVAFEEMARVRESRA